MEGSDFRRSWYLKRLAELHALTPLSQMKMLDRVFEVVKWYDDLLRVEVGERAVTVGVRRFNHGSRDRFVVNHRVSRIAVPLLEEPMHKCPECGEMIEHLSYYAWEFVKCEFRPSGDYLDQHTVEVDPGTQDYDCPKCGKTLFHRMSEAEASLNTPLGGAYAQHQAEEGRPQRSRRSLPQMGQRPRG